MKKALLRLAGFSALFISLTGVAMACSWWPTPPSPPACVPEPSSLALLLTGGGGLGTWLLVKARSKK